MKTHHKFATKHGDKIVNLKDIQVAQPMPHGTRLSVGGSFIDVVDPFDHVEALLGCDKPLMALTVDPAPQSAPAAPVAPVVDTEDMPKDEAPRKHGKRA